MSHSLPNCSHRLSGSHISLMLPWGWEWPLRGKKPSHSNGSPWYVCNHSGSNSRETDLLQSPSKEFFYATNLLNAIVLLWETWWTCFSLGVARERWNSTKYETLGQVKADMGNWKFREEVGEGRLLGGKGATSGPKGREDVTTVWRKARYPWQQERH